MSKTYRMQGPGSFRVKLPYVKPTQRMREREHQLAVHRREREWEQDRKNHRDAEMQTFLDQMNAEYRWEKRVKAVKRLLWPFGGR